MTTVYTVHAYRWGDRQRHSYTVGVFADEEAALQAATEEEDLRGGKYGCEVLQMTIGTVIAGISRPDDKRVKVVKELPDSSLFQVWHESRDGEVCTKAEKLEAAIQTAMSVLEQIAEAPRNSHHRRLAKDAVAFLWTQLVHVSKPGIDIAELHKDTDRLRYVMEACDFDGFVNVQKDRYSYAAEVAEENGRDEPTADDCLDGFRRLIDCSMSGGDDH